jgi:phage shock protein E
MDADLVYVMVAGALIGLFISRRLLGKVSPAAARKLVDDGAKLVDVRTVAEFAGGHIDGAVNVPVQELGGRLGELGDKAAPIVVYCRSGARSGRAKRILMGSGFTTVHDLGSIGRWR